ncbi:FBP domain-containing protein [Actinospica sp. MGRD01-02]|uniref:FBP domain-containing protein n=1 Tax=Actinospica acidithermotolerans TaxID=2828514 RepID=A0A941IIS2_9ACTN|nr:FBP domain-containing protein [Actinospica acidithermotolerans]MBR7827097.1 FBP domain-containing protein [Actinospica acidithermotolerans]
MRPVTESEIRTCFVNCSKGEALRMNLPRDFADVPWEDLDFLGWRDPGAPDRGYLVAERGEKGLVGVSLRSASGGGRGFTARSICSICKTTRTGGGVALLSARRAGESGRNGNTVGQYICSDLACSLYVRGKKVSAGTLLDETLETQARIARVEKGLDAFLNKITAG